MGHLRSSGIGKSRSKWPRMWKRYLRYSERWVGAPSEAISIFLSDFDMHQVAMNHNMSQNKWHFPYEKRMCCAAVFTLLWKNYHENSALMLMMMRCVVHTARIAHKQTIRCKTNIRLTKRHSKCGGIACRTAASRRRGWGKFDAVRHAVELTESLRQSSLFVFQISKMNTEYEICEQTTSSASLTVADSIHGFEFQWRIHFLFEKILNSQTSYVVRRS